MLEVTDDSGFLALVVPATYETFVDENWTLEQILKHFTAQMTRRSLLIWGTGLEGYWKVDIVFEKAEIKGFREVIGPLKLVGGSLLLTSYESLTMAAQSKNFILPEKHQEDLLISLPDGDYICRIMQMFDPDKESFVGNNKPDFMIEVREAAGAYAEWKSIPWFEIGE